MHCKTLKFFPPLFYYLINPTDKILLQFSSQMPITVVVLHKQCAIHHGHARYQCLRMAIHDMLTVGNCAMGCQVYDRLEKRCDTPVYRQEVRTSHLPWAKNSSQSIIIISVMRRHLIRLMCFIFYSIALVLQVILAIGSAVVRCSGEN